MALTTWPRYRQFGLQNNLSASTVLGAAPEVTFVCPAFESDHSLTFSLKDYMSFPLRRALFYDI